MSREISSDIAPFEGRDAVDALTKKNILGKGCHWRANSFSIMGSIPGPKLKNAKQMITLTGQLEGVSDPDLPGWIELETASESDGASTMLDLLLIGTRPLPVADITCVCRHPLSANYLVAGTRAGKLLLLDAHLPNNLKIVEARPVSAIFQSLVACGPGLLGLVTLSSGVQIHRLQLDSDLPYNSFSYHLSLPLIALAENDFTSFWGLTRTGEVYLLELPKEKESRALDRIGVATPGRESFVPRQIKQIRLGRGKIHRLQKMIKLTKTDNYKSLAFDGQRFWVTSERVPNSGTFELSTYRQDGTGLRVLPRRPEVAPSSLSYIHNNLIVLDSVHQQLHYYHLTDNLEMVAPVKDNSDTQNKLRLTSWVHPGYLPAGSPACGGIHNLCLLYVGGVGKKEVHRYNPAKLRPLVSYIETNGEIKDFFMDGFLMLAQYSPLLNGRTYGLDLSGESSRQEDWEALFEEYFSPESNLSALDYSVNEAKQDLAASTYRVKVVLMLPTPSYQVRNWDGKGLSLVSPKNRIDVFRWAMQELINRWKQAKFKNLDLLGFYYMTEQGVWDDPVLHAFPQLCRQFGYRSFAIPGITSSWMTEFTRAGFDCVSLQPSHAFAWNLFRPARYLLKYAGRIAREYGMGIEVELPYEVEKPGGRQKVYDYLEMAKIQGWAGAFKAYFQSYNLIKTLAESKIPEARKLYVELYRFSCLSRRLNHAVAKPSLTSDPYIFYQAQLPSDKKQRLFKINIEGNPGTVVLSRLQFKP